MCLLLRREEASGGKAWWALNAPQALRVRTGTGQSTGKEKSEETFCGQGCCRRAAGGELPQLSTGAHGTRSQEGKDDLSGGYS